MTALRSRSSPRIAGTRLAAVSPRTCPDLSLTVPNSGKRELLGKTLTALADVRSLALDVTVVDNASDDGSVEMVRERFPWADLVVEDEKGGSSRNFNAGLERARGRYIGILHEDAVPDAGALERLVAFLDANPAAGCVAPVARRPDGSPDTVAAPFPAVGAEVRYAFRVRLRDGAVARFTPTEPVRVDWIAATCLIFRRTALEEVGLFDENF